MPDSRCDCERFDVQEMCVAEERERREEADDGALDVSVLGGAGVDAVPQYDAGIDGRTAVVFVEPRNEAGDDAALAGGGENANALAYHPRPLACRGWTVKTSEPFLLVRQKVEEGV